jgi:hypothetical protein
MKEQKKTNFIHLLCRLYEGFMERVPLFILLFQFNEFDICFFLNVQPFICFIFFFFFNNI